jgi:hypothetical protein
MGHRTRLEAGEARPPGRPPRREAQFADTTVQHRTPGVAALLGARHRRADCGSDGGDPRGSGCWFVVHDVSDTGRLPECGDDGRRIDLDRWRPLIMAFQRFFGLTDQLRPSKLATIDEEWYR